VAKPDQWRATAQEGHGEKIAARQRIETLFKLRRPPYAVSASMRYRIARALQQ